MTEQEQAITAELEAMGFTMTVEFVPFSRSRNAKDGAKLNERSINWRVTITRGRTSFSTDYMQGIGHLPKHLQTPWNGRAPVDLDRAIREAVETGRAVVELGRKATQPLSPPTLADVMYCLTMDAGAIDYTSFEEWAESLGMNPDSRQDEKTYQACLRAGLFLRNAVGGACIEKLRELFEDY